MLMIMMMTTLKVNHAGRTVGCAQLYEYGDGQEGKAGQVDTNQILSKNRRQIRSTAINSGADM